MTNLVNTEQKVISVMLLLFADPELTQKDACEQVEIDPRTYRNWIQSGNDTIELLRTLISNQQREILFEATSVQLAGISLLKKDVLKENLDIGDRIKGLRYLKEIADELQRVHHAVPGREEEAHDFLRQGPVIAQQDSTITRMEIRAAPDAGIQVDLISHEKVEDAEFRDVDQTESLLPSNSHSPDQPPEESPD
jgi:hypothetical protein